MQPIAAMPRSGGTVRIPAGEYSFSTTIKLTRAGQHLVCDPGATLRYTGNGDAILVDTTAGGGLETRYRWRGGMPAAGHAAAQNGIHLLPGNMFAIRGMRISGFSKGNGIELSGANNVQIVRNSIYDNQHGIDMVTIPHFAPNAVHVANNEISTTTGAFTATMAMYRVRARWRMSIATTCSKETTPVIYFWDGMRTRWWREIILNRLESRLPPARLATTSTTFTSSGTTSR